MIRDHANHYSIKNGILQDAPIFFVDLWVISFVLRENVKRTHDDVVISFLLAENMLLLTKKNKFFCG